MILKILVIFLILCFAYAALAYVRVQYIVKKAANPALTHSEVVLGNGPALRYIAAGDSTAVGIGTPSTDLSYPTIVAQTLAKTNTVTYANTGRSGARTADFITEQLPKIIAFKPDIITISIGSNDQTRLRSNTAILENTEQILNTLTTETTATIYLANLPDFSGVTLLPYPHVRAIKHRIHSFNPTLNQFKSERVRIVPIHKLGPVQLSADQFHPSSDGYRQWAEAFIHSIKQ